jgi:DNA anti-recombination protein RmuC
LEAAEMSEEISAWVIVWIAALVGMVIGVFLTLWLRRLPEAQQLKQQLDELRQRIDEGQKTIATQEQIDRIRENLSKTHESIVRVSEGIQSLANFAQQTLHPEVTHQLQDVQKNLAQSLADIRNVQEGLSQVHILTSMEKAVEHIKESIEDLTTTLLGRRSGQVGERIVETSLIPLLGDWIEQNVRLGEGTVEFALKLPGGYLVPLDSKFVSPEITRRLAHDTGSDERQQQQARQQINDLVKRRAQEIANYLVDERTVGFGIAAVPDAAYEACKRAIQTVAQRHQIVIVPYSLLLPYTMSLYLMAQRLGIIQMSEKERAIGTAQTALREAKRHLENMEKEITTVANLREKALKQVEKALESFEFSG